VARECRPDGRGLELPGAVHPQRTARPAIVFARHDYAYDEEQAS
jgi:hypothetical protein